MWTHFWDMHSGGSLKEQWQHIYIEAPQAEAKVIFYNRFGHNPQRVTCTCCGDDYAISEGRSLYRLTDWHRERAFKEHVADHPKGNDKLTLKEYEALPYVLFIRAKDITDGERSGDVPVQGYVWM